MKPKPRVLTFESMDQLLIDVENLRTGGYDKAGNWDLPQLLSHLTKATHGLIDAKVPPMLGPIRWIGRVVIRRMARRDRYLSIKIPAPKFMQPEQHLSIEQAHAGFKQAVDLAANLPEGMIDTPTFGPLDSKVLKKLMLLHSAHHLSHLIPKAGS